MNPAPLSQELTVTATRSLPRPNKFALITQSIPSCKRKKILKLFKDLEKVEKAGVRLIRRASDVWRNILQGF